MGESKERREHFLNNNQLHRLYHLSMSNQMTMASAAQMISAYIYDRKGVQAHVKPETNEKFEKAATIASNYFILSGEELGFQVRQNIQFTFGGQPANNDNLTKEQLEFLRKNGAHI